MKPQRRMKRMTISFVGVIAVLLASVGVAPTQTGSAEVGAQQPAAPLSPLLFMAMARKK
jgi:hypothetical protein